MTLTAKELAAIIKIAVDAALADRPTKTEYVYLPSPTVPVYRQPWELPIDPYRLPTWESGEYLVPSIYKSPAGGSN